MCWAPGSLEGAQVGDDSPGFLTEPSVVTATPHGCRGVTAETACVTGLVSPPVTNLPRGVVANLGDRPVTYEDVVLAGMLGDEWDSLVAWSAEGIRRHVGGVVDASEVRRVAERFRRARRLEAGQALRAWLAERDITIPEWEAYLGRRVALGEGFGFTDRPSTLPVAFDAVLRVDSFCNRFWEVGAKRVIEWMAAQHLLGDTTGTAIDVSQIVEAALADDAAKLSDKGAEWCQERLATLASWSEAYSRLGGSVATEAAIQSTIEAHWSEWSFLHLDVCRLASEPAAREALISATDDGTSPEEIARRAHATLRREVVRARDLEKGILPILLSTTIDEPTGPFRIGTDWVVMWVRARQPADASDPLVRADAVDALVSAAVEREMRGTVRWSAPV
jgi:hypothetical protein